MEKPTNSLSSLRKTLKYKIYNERSVLGYPECPICKGRFHTSEPSMHEVFIPRGVVKGCSQEVQEKIYVPENVVLIHEQNNCHIIAQHEMQGKVACAIQIIAYQGYENILNWMKDIDSCLKTKDFQKYSILEDAMREYEKRNNASNR